MLIEYKAYGLCISVIMFYKERPRKNMLSFGPGHFDRGRETSVHYCLLVLSGNIFYRDYIPFFPTKNQ